MQSVLNRGDNRIVEVPQPGRCNSYLVVERRETERVADKTLGRN